MIDPKSAAIVIWMPDGERPSIESYQVPDREAPETSGYFELGVALIVATKGPPREGKKAWVKVGTELISPEKCEIAYEDFKMGRDVHA